MCCIPIVSSLCPWSNATARLPHINRHTLTAARPINVRAHVCVQSNMRYETPLPFLLIFICFELQSQTNLQYISALHPAAAVLTLTWVVVVAGCGSVPGGSACCSGPLLATWWRSRSPLGGRAPSVSADWRYWKKQPLQCLECCLLLPPPLYLYGGKSTWAQMPGHTWKAPYWETSTRYSLFLFIFLGS